MAGNLAEARTSLKSKFSNKYAKNFLTYLLTGGINKLIPIVLLPILTRYLSPVEFGQLNNFNVLVGLYTAIIALRLPSYLQADYYKINTEELRELLSNIFWIYVFLAIILYLISWIFDPYIIEYFGLDSWYTFLAVVTAIGGTVFSLRSAIFVLEERPKKYGIYQFAQSFIAALLTIVLVVVFLMNWQGRVYALAISGILFFLNTIFYLYRKNYLIYTINISKIRELLAFGLPLIPQSITPFLRKGMDKLLISSYIGLAANGIFSLAISIGSVFTVLLSSYFTVFMPHLYKTLSKEYVKSDAKERDMRKLRGLILVSCLLFVGVALLTWLILSMVFPIIFNDDYLKALPLLPWVLIEAAIMGCSKLLAYLLLYDKKTSSLGIITFISGLAHVLTSYLLVREYSFYGLLVGMYVGSCTRLLIIIYLIKRHSSFRLFGKLSV